MVMKTTLVNIGQAKAHLSEYARRVKKGDRIILCDRNKPFAEIRRLGLSPNGRRPFGLAQGHLKVPDSFNDPDADSENLFETGAVFP